MTAVADNLIQPFLVHQTDVRGRLVRLGSQVDEIMSRHNYPEPVARSLAELLAFAAVSVRRLSLKASLPSKPKATALFP